MKLILGSDLSFLLKYGYSLTGISKDQMKIGYINTAVKGEGEKIRLFMEKVKNSIRENGYSFEEIDIEGKTKEKLEEFFKDKNIIHIDGGNTFYLLRAIKEIYIGTSAGAYVVCPSIEVSNWNPDSKDRFGLIDFTALNYYPFFLKVHYKDESEALVKEKMKTLKYPIHILRDGQGIFVEDDKYTFVGDGEEVKL